MRGLLYTALVLTGIWAMIWLVPFINRVVFVFSESAYESGTLTVTDARYIPASNSGTTAPTLASWWAIGDIALADGTGLSDEAVSLSGVIDDPGSRDGILRQIALGETFPVLVNEDMPGDVLSQGESFRVIRDRPGFFADQRALARMMFLKGLGPFLLTGMAALGIEWSRRRGGAEKSPA